MFKKSFILTVCLPIFACTGQVIHAQFQQENYFSIGKNHSSNGVYYKPANITTCRFKKSECKLGLSFQLQTQNKKRFEGFLASYSINYRIKSFPLNTEIIFLLNPYHSTMYEMNPGLLFHLKKNRFVISLGNNLKIYQLSRKTIQQKNIERGSEKRIIEPRNLMYRLTWFIKPAESKWNISLNATNYDYFLIMQETNPMVYERFQYKLTSKIIIYNELWYQQAGLFNIRVNFFGFYVKTGVQWKIN